MDSITYAQSFNVYILVYSNFIVSFHFQPLASVSSVIKRLEQLKTFLHVTPHWINYAILDDITDKYGPMIQSVEMEVESIDDLVLVISHHEQMDMLRRISLARKRLTVFQRLMSAKLDVLRILIKRLESMSMGKSFSPI
jgi:magnesium transporter